MRKKVAAIAVALMIALSGFVGVAKASDHRPWAPTAAGENGSIWPTNGNGTIWPF